MPRIRKKLSLVFILIYPDRVKEKEPYWSTMLITRSYWVLSFGIKNIELSNPLSYTISRKFGRNVSTIINYIIVNIDSKFRLALYIQLIVRIMIRRSIT